MTRARDVANIDGLLTTTGDTYYASAAGTPARLGIGSSGQVLTVSGGVPTWATASSGGMTLLETGSLTGASVTTGSLSQSYNSLYVVLRDFLINVDGRIWLRANGVSAANSYFNYVNPGNGTQAFAHDYIGLTVGIDNTVNENLAIIEIPDYTNSTTYKFTKTNSIYVDYDVTTSFGYVNATNGAIKGTAAITTLTFLMTGGTSFTAGTYFVYGVK
jgi:hypothetical protein